MTSKLIQLKTTEIGIIEDEDIIAKTTGVMYSGVLGSREYALS